MGSPATPGTFFCFAAMILLIFASVSVPTWHAVSFLNVGPPSDTQMRYGVFGYTGSGISLGYSFTDPRVNSDTLQSLTSTLILHPIAAGLSFFAFISGVCGVGYHRSGTIFMTLISLLSLLTTFVAWVIDMVLFGIARNRYNEFTTAEYGVATWLTLSAFVALLLAFCTSACGVFGRYRKRDGTH